MTLHKRKSALFDTDDGFVAVDTMDVEPLIEGVKMMSDAQLEAPVKDRAGRIYLGSVDPITAVNWAKESGTDLYSKEWKEYALKQLKSSNYSQFRAAPVRKYF